eukprot:11057504-Alexandrium_andersonii.AAC.1
MSMTSDEFISEGINNAELAQAAMDLDQSQMLLERSIWCFEQTDIIEPVSYTHLTLPTICSV